MVLKTIGLALVLLLGLFSASLAQSTFTTGTIANSARAGYGAGGSGRLFAYAPGYHGRHHRRYRR